MALTADQAAWYGKQLGTPLDEADIEARLARLELPEAVVVEVLETRLATMANKPISFSVAGEYSENRADNLKLLTEQLGDARAALSAAGGDPTPGSAMVGVLPGEQRWSR